MKRHWYFISMLYCPLCGRTIVTRERRYGRKPSEAKQREVIDHWCGCGAL